MQIPVCIFLYDRNMIGGHAFVVISKMLCAKTKCRRELYEVLGDVVWVFITDLRSSTGVRNPFRTPAMEGQRKKCRIETELLI